MNIVDNPTIKNKRRGGRPPNPNRRCKSITTHFSEAEYEEVVAKIKHAGLSKNAAGRLLFLSEDLPKVVVGGVHVGAAELYAKLQPLQSNINQVAHHLNQQRPTNLSAEAIQKIAKLVLAAEKTVKDFRSWVLTHQPNISQQGGQP